MQEKNKRTKQALFLNDSESTPSPILFIPLLLLLLLNNRPKHAMLLISTGRLFQQYKNNKQNKQKQKAVTKANTGICLDNIQHIKAIYQTENRRNFLSRKKIPIIIRPACSFILYANTSPFDRTAACFIKKNPERGKKNISSLSSHNAAFFIMVLCNGRSVHVHPDAAVTIVLQDGSNSLHLVLPLLGVGIPASFLRISHILCRTPLSSTGSSIH